MKILFIGYHLDSLISSCKYYFWKAFDRRSDVELIHYGFHNPRSMILPEISRANRWITFGMSELWKRMIRVRDIKNISKIILDNSPDVLMFNERFLKHMEWRNFDFNIPMILQINDQHAIRNNNLRNFVKNNNVVLILSRHYFPIKYFQKMVDISIKLFPWSVDLNIFKDYGYSMKYDLISSGVISRPYPFRYKILEIMDDISDIKFHYMKYPNISMLGNYETLNMMDIYAKTLSVSKEFVFCSSIWRQSIQKYFEGMASNCIVFSTFPNDARHLGFIPNKNFVEVDEHNLLDNARYYLENEDERMKIVRNGNNIIRKYHTVDIRIDELLSYIKEVI